MIWSNVTICDHMIALKYVNRAFLDFSGWHIDVSGRHSKRVGQLAGHKRRVTQRGRVSQNAQSLSGSCEQYNITLRKN